MSIVLSILQWSLQGHWSIVSSLSKSIWTTVCRPTSWLTSQHRVSEWGLSANCSSSSHYSGAETPQFWSGIGPTSAHCFVIVLHGPPIFTKRVVSTWIVLGPFSENFPLRNRFPKKQQIFVCVLGIRLVWTTFLGDRTHLVQYKTC